jgi:hemolysin D
VVTEAQPLMTIVPNDAEISAEVILDNKDLGFVHEWQIAEVKLETFNFTRYGTVQARVKRVSADAVQDEKRGAVFPVTLELGRRDIHVDGVRLPVSPGLNLTAEIRMGKRKVASFLLDPLRITVNESLRER